MIKQHKHLNHVKYFELWGSTPGFSGGLAIGIIVLNLVTPPQHHYGLISDQIFRPKGNPSQGRFRHPAGHPSYQLISFTGIFSGIPITNRCAGKINKEMNHIIRDVV